MHAILQSVVGGPGPLIVEHEGRTFFEHCFTITEKHVNNISKKFENYDILNIEQTTDRSFLILTKKVR
jgi:hypothetical protein